MHGSNHIFLGMTNKHKLQSYPVHFAELKDIQTWAGLFDQFAYTTKPCSLHQKAKIQNWPEAAQLTKRFAGTLCLLLLEVPHTSLYKHGVSPSLLSVLFYSSILLLWLPDWHPNPQSTTHPARCSVNNAPWVVAFSVGDVRRLRAQAKTCSRW